MQPGQSPLVNGCNTSKKMMDEARADWEVLSDKDKLFWEEQEQAHDLKQPEIIQILEESLAKNPKRSAKKLSEDIGFWCGKTTIGKWKNLRMGPSYRKGIQNPVSRDNQYLHLIATTALANLKHKTNDDDGPSEAKPLVVAAAASPNATVELPEVSEHDDSLGEDNIYGDASERSFEENYSRRSSLSSFGMDHSNDENMVI